MPAIPFTGNVHYRFEDKYDVHIWLGSVSLMEGAVEFVYDNRLKYILFLHTDLAQCRAKEGDELAISVCKSFGGTKNTVYDGFENYPIPGYK